MWDGGGGASRTERHVVSWLVALVTGAHETKGRGGGLVEQIQKKQKKERVVCGSVECVLGCVCFGER